MVEKPRPRSHLFTLRLWSEEVGEQLTEWRGKVQYIRTGVIRYFRDWDGLVQVLEDALGGGQDDLPPAPPKEPGEG